MARYERFTFLCTAGERWAIAELALRLRRSQSDAVRFLIIEATRQLSQAQPAAQATQERETECDLVARTCGQTGLLHDSRLRDKQDSHNQR
jgi:hypothetical protein